MEDTQAEKQFDYIVKNIHKLTLQQKYDISKIIMFYQPDVMKQTNNGVWIRYADLDKITISMVYTSLKKKLNN